MVVKSAHDMEDDMIVLDEFLDLVVFLVRSDYSVDAEFCVEDLGFFRLTDEGGDVEGVAVGMVKKSGQDGASDVTST